MISKNDIENIIVLFDEHGTPTFDKRETDIFLGVAVAYNINSEQKIFEKCNALFGLSNKNPLKNDRIGPDSANTCADQVFRSIAVDPNNPLRIIVGTEGNGIFLRTAG